MTTATEERQDATQPAPAAVVAVRGDQSNVLRAKIQYAKALADSGLLPAHYRRQPANVLFAVEYGDMLGLPPMAAITGIHIIEGKPTASAGLISALVRRAGHKLRVGYEVATMTGWAEIIRADDPDYTFRSEWNLDRAVTAELCTIRDGQPFALDSKGRSLPWRKFFPSMTKARAITEVARDACEEALYGLHYTPEELGAEVGEDGSLLGEMASGAPASNGTRAAPDDDPWYTHPAPERDEGWLTQAREAAASVPDTASATALWAQIGEKLTAGAIAKADADALAEVIKARVADLAADAEGEPVEGEIVDDDPDGWMAKVADILTAEDADAARADLDVTARSSGMTARRHSEIADAISARKASLA